MIEGATFLKKRATWLWLMKPVVKVKSNS